jgi:outer membrane protein OmpA-like peptidoglycan-associated protein
MHQDFNNKMRYIITILLVICSIVSLNAQLSTFEAEKLKKAGYYAEAIDELSKRVGAPNYNVNMGMLSYQVHNYKEALVFFNKISNKEELTTEQKSVFFETLRINQEYSKANLLIPTIYGDRTNYFEKNFITYPLANTELKKAIDVNEVDIDFGKSFMGLNVNKNELIIVKSTNRYDDKYDLYSYEFPDNSFFEKNKSRKIKAEFSNFLFRANPTFINDENYIYTKSITDNVDYKTKKADESISNNLLKLFDYNSGTNTETEISILNRNNTNTVTPYYWKSQKIIFYSVSDAVNENFDIYYSKNTGATWSAPQKVEGINTEYNEVYPFVKNNKLYFSSRSYGNYGGLDVFKVNIKVEDDKVVVLSSPKNIGKPINSSFDDFGLVYTNDTIGFFASNREGEKGSDKLYRFIDKSIISFPYLIKDKSDFVVNKAVIDVFELDENNNKIYIATVESDEQGNFILPIDVNEKYIINIKAEGYDTEDKLVSVLPGEEVSRQEIILTEVEYKSVINDALTTESINDVEVLVYEFDKISNQYKLVKTIKVDEKGNWSYPFNRNKKYKVELNKVDYELETFIIPSFKDENRGSILSQLNNVNFSKIVKKDDIYTINTITFDLNSSIITSESYAKLDNVIVFLNKNPSVKIELGAHTDCEANSFYNLWLSRQRAKSCFKYLVKKGVSKKRLVPVGYGEENILNGCIKEGQCTKQENRINRRVEIKILAQ